MLYIKTLFWITHLEDFFLQAIKACEEKRWKRDLIEDESNSTAEGVKVIGWQFTLQIC